MLEPAVFGVYGSSDSGKTTLLTALVKQFSDEGFKVATIKRTDKAISLDSTGKDTWRHQEAGATLTVFSSATETDFLVKKPMSIFQMVQRITDFDYYDLILVEGADEPDIKKIQVGAGIKRENTVCEYLNDIDHVIDLIKADLQKKVRPSKLVITVNGKNIPLTEFPEAFIANTLVGMVRSLKGVDQIDTVSIQFKR